MNPAGARERPEEAKMERARIGILRAMAGGLLLAWAVLPVAGARADFSVYLGANTMGSSCGPSIGELTLSTGESGTVHLCFENDPGNLTPSTADVCATGDGPEVCSVLVTAMVEGDMTIDGFQIPAGAVADQFHISTDQRTLSVIATDVSTGFLGPTFLGTIDVTATGTSGRLDVSAEWHGAMFTPNATPEDPLTLVSGQDTCGDGTIDFPPEWCDDANTNAGDGCLGCRLERSIQVIGTATGGQVSFDFEEAAAPIVVSTNAGENAQLTVNTLVSRVTSHPGFPSSLIFVKDPSLSDVIRNNATYLVPDITENDAGIELVLFVPEPHAWLQLAACLGGLAALARLRGRQGVRDTGVTR